jgi:predicted 3-demethylubiquinone-9 3-methyltransferase (glyoxalase superfamily)
MQKVSTFLWFDDGAEDAAKLYTSLIPDSRILDVKRFGDAMPGGLIVVTFTLGGVEYQAMNGGPGFPFTEAISLSVICDDQAEVDRLWEALTADGGEESMCGWLKDRFGFSWQVTPRQIFETIGGPDAAGRERAMAAMMQMRKLDIAKLQAAYAGTAA